MIYIIVVLLSVILYLSLDYHGPKKIHLRQAIVFGMNCLKAKDLIVQEYDYEGNLWATRGMVIYRLKNGGNSFIRMAHVPSGHFASWLNNFTIFRKIIQKPECIEITITALGEICALSGGHIWHHINGGRKFYKSMKLPHFGIGVGRGILSTGLLNTNNNMLFFGEYFRNEERTYVRVYKNENSGGSWEIAYEFEPGEIRHIHSVQVDPYTGKLWLCAGDTDTESRIGWSDDLYKTLNIIGQGSQIWRITQLVFTENAVYWGTDAGSIGNLAGIYCWDKVSFKLTKVQIIEGVILYGTRLKNGTIVLSMEREGAKNEKDAITRLFIITNEDRIKHINCGTWKNKKSWFGLTPARLRLQRNQGSDSLAVTCLNQKEIANSDLIIIKEDILL